MKLDVDQRGADGDVEERFCICMRRTQTASQSDCSDVANPKLSYLWPGAVQAMLIMLRLLLYTTRSDPTS